jgi:hypothetical protein
MLIGIMHYTWEPRATSSPFKYHSRVFQRGSLMRNTDLRSMLDNLLDTLRAFRQEWQDYRQSLVPFDFSASTGFCPDVLVEISEYLWLNDAINAFSLSILPLLHQSHCKVHLHNPSDRSLEVILRYLDPRQITSLHMTAELFKSERYSSTLRIFDQLC